MMTNQNQLLFGVPHPPPQRIPLQAGALNLVFEGGDLRSIRLRDQEIIQRVYVAVRGPLWETIPMEITPVSMNIQDNAFHIQFQAHHQQGPVNFSWTGTITGTPDSTIRFDMNGKAHSNFLRNRIGFCVLHPFAECAGQPCEVESVDGKTISGTFPSRISPHQPFKNILAIRHNLKGGETVEVRLEGDIFEMEDQRNWCDASFKTYSTPLDLPKPVEIKSGEIVQQSVTVKLVGQSAVVKSISSVKIVPQQPQLTFDLNRRQPLPRLGLCASDRLNPLSQDEIRLLKALHLSHLRVEAHPCWAPSRAPSLAGFEGNLARGLAEASALDLPVELAVYFSETPQRDAAHLAEILKTQPVHLARVLALDESNPCTSDQAIEAGRQLIANLGAPIPVGGGSRVYFTELNRFPPSFDRLDEVTYSINTQVHANDLRSQLENTRAPGETVKSARQLSGGKPLAIGPLSLRPRFNPHAAAGQTNQHPGELPIQVDPRQAALAGALWTLGCLQSLAESCTESLSAFETAGWKGVIAGDQGSPLPELFPHLPGMVFPLYHVLESLADFNGGQRIEANLTGHAQLFWLGIHKQNRLRLLLGNAEESSRILSMTGISGKALLRRLEVNSLLTAMRDPFEFWATGGEPFHLTDPASPVSLPPYSIHIIDVELAKP